MRLVYRQRTSRVRYGDERPKSIDLSSGYMLAAARFEFHQLFPNVSLMMVRVENVMVV